METSPGNDFLAALIACPAAAAGKVWYRFATHADRPPAKPTVGRRRSESRRLSIAVCHWPNIGQDPKTGAFATGLTNGPSHRPGGAFRSR